MNAEQRIKKTIRLLADKFDHLMVYEKDIMLLKNQVNNIQIRQEDKYGMTISYKLGGKVNKQKLPLERIYDVMLQLLQRQDDHTQIAAKPGVLLTVEEWIKEEGAWARERLENLIRDLNSQAFAYRWLGGNRYQAEYYKGLLIITDDLGWAVSNVIELESIKHEIN